MALKIDNKIVHSSMTEVLMQNVMAFTEGTKGAITLGSELITGDVEEFSMLSEIASIVGDRDIGADTDLTAKTLSSADGDNIKIYFSTGAIEFKLVDAKRYGSNSEAFSMAIGEQIGVGITNYMLNKAIIATVAAIQATAGLVTGNGTATITPTLLNTALKPFGDARGAIVAWVMTGATFNDLVGNQLAVATGGDITANGVLYTDNIGTLNRPAYVTDAAGLAMTVGSAVLGLTRGAVEIIESETREFVSDLITGKDNLKYRIQCESSLLLRVKGFSYDGATNPANAVLGAKANWSQSATDVKSTAGVLLNIA
jgi:hypothetical protein